MVKFRLLRKIFFMCHASMTLHFSFSTYYLGSAVFALHATSGRFPAKRLQIETSSFFYLVPNKFFQNVYSLEFPFSTYKLLKITRFYKDRHIYRRLIKRVILRSLQVENENSKEFTLWRNLLRIREKRLEVSIYSRFAAKLHEVA